MFSSLYRWYIRTFLPFEQPDHPLYAGHGQHDYGRTQYDSPMLQEISDWVEAELGPLYGPFEEERPRYRGSMITHTRSWYAEHDPSVDWDRLPRLY